MRPLELPSNEKLLEYFTPDFEKGSLIRIKRSGTNGKIGCEVYGSMRSGYRSLKFLGTSYPMHRIMYQLFHGELKQSELLDHIDMNKSNNSIENLRIASHSQNTHHVVYENSKSGIHGIDYIDWKYEGHSYRYCRASIIKDGKHYQKRYNVEKYKNALELAIQWRDSKSIELYGEFSPYKKPSQES